MKELIQFLPAYFARNFGITLQGILFVLANDASFFRALSGKKRIIKGILIFLISSTPLTSWPPFPIPG